MLYAGSINYFLLIYVAHGNRLISLTDARIRNSSDFFGPDDMKPELCLDVETYVEETPHLRQSSHDSSLLLAIQRSEGITHDSLLLLAKQ